MWKWFDSEDFILYEIVTMYENYELSMYCIRMLALSKQSVFYALGKSQNTQFIAYKYVNSWQGTDETF